MYVQGSAHNVKKMILRPEKSNVDWLIFFPVFVNRVKIHTPVHPRDFHVLEPRAGPGDEYGRY